MCKWIRITTRTPKPGQVVIAHYAPVQEQGFNRSDLAFISWGDDPLPYELRPRSDITHWLPVPKHFKGPSYEALEIIEILEKVSPHIVEKCQAIQAKLSHRFPVIDWLVLPGMFLSETFCSGYHISAAVTVNGWEYEAERTITVELLETSTLDALGICAREMIHVIAQRIGTEASHDNVP